MILNGEVSAPNVYGVLTDDVACVYKAVAKLAQDGIRRILHFYHSNSYSGKKKQEGYRKAVQEFGLESDEKLLQYYEASLQDIPKMAEYLLYLWNAGVKFDGIITSDDELALGAVKFARLAGLRIPDDLSVIGYSNSMLATSGIMELTSVDIKLEKICQHLISSLLRVFDGEEIPQQAVFNGELIERETTK
jgi:LacI family transcriptional regulator/LacI family asc operon transcriptional repressor